MKKLISEIVFLLVAICVFIFSPTLGYAGEVDKYPSRPISFVVPWPAGNPDDLAIRLLCREAEKLLGQPIVIINKAGAGGTIGTAAIASSKPDGYTIGFTPHSPMILIPHLEQLPYNPARDFQMIMQFGGMNFGVVVKSDSPFKSFKDLIDFARQNPKKLTYGTGGPSSMQNIIMGQIAKKEKVEMTHIPFKAMTDAQPALIGGHILFAAGNFNYSLFDSGVLRILMLLREERSAEYPQVPILKDMGYDFPVPTYLCVAGPKGLPDGVVKKLEDAFTKAMKEPAFIKGMKEDLRMPVVYRNSRDLDQYVKDNHEHYGRILKDLGLVK
jgi:tripartite-type tricarboxylate transporter receptor subunit TctC